MRLIDADALESDVRRAILEFVMEDDFTKDENKQGTVRIMQYWLEVIKEQKTIPVVGVKLKEGK
jgi:hypothetical protein